MLTFNSSWISQKVDLLDLLDWNLLECTYWSAGSQSMSAFGRKKHLSTNYWRIKTSYEQRKLTECEDQVNNRRRKLSAFFFTFFIGVSQNSCTHPRVATIRERTSFYDRRYLNLFGNLVFGQKQSIRNSANYARTSSSRTSLRLSNQRVSFSVFSFEWKWFSFKSEHKFWESAHRLLNYTENLDLDLTFPRMELFLTIGSQMLVIHILFIQYIYLVYNIIYIMQ